MSPSMGAPPNQIQILKISEERTLAPNGTSVTNVVVTFNVGSHGPFQERFDRLTFNPTAVNAKLREFASQLVNVGQ